MCPHKLAHYVAYLLDDTVSPVDIEVILLAMLSAGELCLDSLEGEIPGPDPDWSLGQWWDATVRMVRERVKWALVDEYGEMCECCERLPATDLHEVFVPRSQDTTWRQILLFTVGNCALVCRSCHASGVIYSADFKEKIQGRRERVPG